MILILSSQFDSSTSKVIQWLLFFKVGFDRINGEVGLQNLFIGIENKSSEMFLQDVNNSIFYLDQYDTYWYRRSYLKTFQPILTKYKKSIMFDLQNEWLITENFIYQNFEKKRKLGSLFKEKYHNKLEALSIANQSGLLIPKTIVTSSKKQLLTFIEDNKKYITKALYNTFTIESESKYISIGTELISKSNIAILNELFYPTLVQEYIDKEFEIRVFYLNGSLFSMAIFSQNDSKTKIDFRNYKREKPNRMVPFLLPEKISKKLLKFMHKMELDTGSIDLIYTPKNEFVFLEVNHLGQYDWVSKKCNYFLDYEIASFLKG
jgi:ATP-GRASP peptide maturase of grasp-with-spasm system